jgi:hypothetical protein
MNRDATSHRLGGPRAAGRLTAIVGARRQPIVGQINGSLASPAMTAVVMTEAVLSNFRCLR